MYHEITTEYITYRFGPENEPCLRAEPGDYIEFKTLDAHSGTVNINEVWADVDFPELDDSTGNPVTGLVYIEGAEPGMTLKIEIIQIRPDEIGILPIRSYMGVLRDIVEERTARVVRYAENRVWISPTLSVPARPMIGTIGVSPADESIAAAYPGSHGGNLDNNCICEGSTVYLPVRCPGALLGLGDIHAAMGDGELTCGGADITASVLIRIELMNGTFPLTNPLVIKDGMAVTHGIGGSYEECASMASAEMKTLICNKLNVSPYEAVLLMAARGDLGICQACRCHIPMIIRMAFPVLWNTEPDVINGGMK